MSNEWLDYWKKRRDRLLYVVSRIAEGKRDVTDQQYESLFSALEWCNAKIDKLEDEIECEQEELQYE